MGTLQHLVFHLGKFVPALLHLHVDLGQLPHLQRVGLTLLESRGLLFFRHREIDLVEDDTVCHKVVFKTGHGIHESVVLL